MNPSSIHSLITFQNSSHVTDPDESASSRAKSADALSAPFARSSCTHRSASAERIAESSSAAASAAPKPKKPTSSPSTASSSSTVIVPLLFLSIFWKTVYTWPFLPSHSARHAASRASRAFSCRSLASNQSRLKSRRLWYGVSCVP